MPFLRAEHGPHEHEAEPDADALRGNPSLAWRLAQKARSSGKWALASKLVRIARAAGDKDSS